MKYKIFSLFCCFVFCELMCIRDKTNNIFLVKAQGTDVPEATNSTSDIFGELEPMADKSKSDATKKEEVSEDEVFLKSASPHWLTEAQEFQFSEDSVKIWEKESLGTYSSIGKKLQKCQGLPIATVWNEFSHFFDYSWGKDFTDFSALFLTFWKRESNFAPPSQGVIVQPNCKQKPPLVVRGLKGKNFKLDVVEAEKKMKKIQAHFAGCKLGNTDYGSMQWNYKYRLSQAEYEKSMRKALLISSQYTRKQIDTLNQKKLAQLVKLNPKTLFILAGLDIKKQAKYPKKAIRNYNSKKEYAVMAEKNLKAFSERLKNDGSCAP